MFVNWDSVHERHLREAGPSDWTYSLCEIGRFLVWAMIRYYLESLIRDCLESLYLGQSEDVEFAFLAQEILISLVYEDLYAQTIGGGE